MDQPSPGSYEELAKQYEQSLKEALANLDRIAAEAKEMQTAAVEEIIKTKEERRKIEASAEAIAHEVLGAREKQMEAEIRRVLEVEYITNLLMAGRTRDEISAWLNLAKETVLRVWTSLVGHHSDIDGVVGIIQTGRGGTVVYTVQDKSIPFYWEFGANEVLALIFVPSEPAWEEQTGFPLSKRMEILTFVAQQVIRQRASGSIYRILDDVIEIVLVHK